MMSGDSLSFGLGRSYGSLNIAQTSDLTVPEGARSGSEMERERLFREHPREFVSGF